MGLAGLFDRIKEICVLLKREKLFRILFVTMVIVLFGALAIFLADRFYVTRGPGGIFDAIYWAVVTLTTVGYGDIVPTTKIGKLFALIIILSGPVFLSLITASIASIFVERKIKEGKGLKAIKDKGHIIICGWNESGEKVIDGLLVQAGDASPKIAIISELDRDEVQSIQYRYEGHDIRFVRGNFVNEDVLARANLKGAASVIVLADVSGGRDIEKADERTVFGSMAIKSMAPMVRVCAELIKSENREHLKRTKVDDIIVRGETTGSLLAKASLAPGLADSIKLLVDNGDDNKLWRIPVPSRYASASFGELSAHLREKHGALLLALVKEEEKMGLDDILSDDSTFIDEFIRRKFEESGKDFFETGGNISVTINPPDNHRLSKNDWLVVISRERP